MKTTTHTLKVLPQYFKSLKNGTKSFELRWNDRNFQVGDILILEEYDMILQKYTGNRIIKTITYLLNDFPGLTSGWVILSLNR